MLSLFMTKEQVGLEIKTRRNKLKLTQKQLAEKLGIKVQHVPNIEKGVTNISLNRLLAICAALDMEISFKAVKKPV